MNFLKTGKMRIMQEFVRGNECHLRLLPFSTNKKTERFHSLVKLKFGRSNYDSLKIVFERLKTLNLNYGLIILYPKIGKLPNLSGKKWEMYRSFFFLNGGHPV